jgi:hypothetical protein
MQYTSKKIDLEENDDKNTRYSGFINRMQK